jgi:putative transposase
MSVLSYVFKVLPSRAQHAALDAMLENQRQFYNAALQERIWAWRRGVSIGLNDQTKSLTEIRKFDAGIGGVPYDVSKWTLKRLDDSMKAFFKRAKARCGKAGFPRFRGKAGWSTFGFHQTNGLRLKSGKLLFGSGIVGGLTLKMHRPLPEGSVIKSASFTKEALHWRVALVIETADAVVHNHPAASCGIDVGVEALATLSDGTRIENIRPSKAAHRKLRQAARALSRCKRGSNRRRKVRAKLAAAQRKVRNIRTTYLHQVSAKITRQYGLIAVEDLKLKNMTRSAKGTLAEPGTKVRQKAGLNRSLADAAPGRLIEMIRYKAESAGGVMIKVDPRYTSQMCNACGVIVAKPLNERRHVCPCGTNMHRDYNAAINILERGLAAHEAARRLGEPNVDHQVVRAPGKTAFEAA